MAAPVVSSGPVCSTYYLSNAVLTALPCISSFWEPFTPVSLCPLQLSLVVGGGKVREMATGNLSQLSLTCSPENAPPHRDGSLYSWRETRAEHRTRLGRGCWGSVWPTVTVTHSGSCHNPSRVIVP